MLMHIWKKQMTKDKSNYFPFCMNGLRAIAVVAVIIFHLDPSFLPNGFLGVDVFL